MRTSLSITEPKYLGVSEVETEVVKPKGTRTRSACGYESFSRQGNSPELRPRTVRVTAEAVEVQAQHAELRAANERARVRAAEPGKMALGDLVGWLLLERAAETLRRAENEQFLAAGAGLEAADSTIAVAAFAPARDLSGASASARVSDKFEAERLSAWEADNAGYEAELADHHATRQEWLEAEAKRDFAEIQAKRKAFGSRVQHPLVPADLAKWVRSVERSPRIENPLVAVLLQLLVDDAINWSYQNGGEYTSDRFGVGNDLLDTREGVRDDELYLGIPELSALAEREPVDEGWVREQGEGMYAVGHHAARLQYQSFKHLADFQGSTANPGTPVTAAYLEASVEANHAAAELREAERRQAEAERAARRTNALLAGSKPKRKSGRKGARAQAA